MAFKNPHPAMTNVAIDGKIHHIFPGRVVNIPEHVDITAALAAGHLVETDEEGEDLATDLSDIKKGPQGVKSEADEPTTVATLKTWLDDRQIAYDPAAKKPELQALYEENKDA
jgi:hypothetical protein